MSDTNLTLTRELGGAEDLLLDANLPHAVTQARLVGDTVQNITVHKINWETFPVAGKYGDANFVSLRSMLDDMSAKKAKKCAIDTTGRGLCITIGDADAIWDGGAPASNEFALAQVLPNGHYRWVGKGTSGGDKFTFRGKVAGQAGTSASDFTTKAQLDALRAYVDTVKALANTQADWNESNSSSRAYIKHKPSIPSAAGNATHGTAGLVKGGYRSELDAGTDTTYRAWTAKDLKAFSLANASGGGWVSGRIADGSAWHVPDSNIHMGVSWTSMSFPYTVDADDGVVVQAFIVEKTGSFKFTFTGQGQGENSAKIVKNNSTVWYKATAPEGSNPTYKLTPTISARAGDRLMAGGRWRHLKVEKV